MVRIPLRPSGRFRDRREAGERLVALLGHLRAEHPVVVGLPRGGVPVAAVVADALDAPLDVIVVRKLGLPHRPEVGMGAVGEDGARVIDDATLRATGVTPDELAAVEHRERRTVEERVARVRRRRPAVPLAGRTVVVVDDGIATGGTVRAALAVARARGARRVVLAVPVAPADTLAELARLADEVVCARTPADFGAVGRWYDDFEPVTDTIVERILDDAHRPGRTTAGGVAVGEPVGARVEEPVGITTAGVVLGATLAVPPSARGVVVFAHGSGSSRHSPRNRFVAEVLRRSGFATLLLDLLTATEATDRTGGFDVELFADRLLGTVRWLHDRSDSGGLPVGLFGASSGAAVALVAAARSGGGISAVVARGGRPDLAAAWLERVSAPTLLVVGERDVVVLGRNRDAVRRLGGPARLVVVPGASHLFEEPGTLATTADLAVDWFAEHLVRPTPVVPVASSEGNTGATHAGWNAR